LILADREGSDIVKGRLADVHGQRPAATSRVPWLSNCTLRERSPPTPTWLTIVAPAALTRRASAQVESGGVGEAGAADGLSSMRPRLVEALPRRQAGEAPRSSARWAWAANRSLNVQLDNQGTLTCSGR